MGGRAPTENGQVPAPAILFVETSPYESYGGSKRVLVNLVSALDPDRWATRAIFYRQGPWVADLTRRGVPVELATQLAPGPPPSDAAVRGVAGRLRGAGVRRDETGEPALAWPRRLLREARFALRMQWTDAQASNALERYLRPAVDLIHFNAGMHTDWAWYHLARRHRIPYLLHEHGIWRSPVRAWRAVACNAASVLCLTRDRMERVRAFCGGGVRVDLLPNGVPRQAFGPHRDRAATRASLGLDAATPLFVTAGHLQAWKGQDLAVEAARRLAAEGREFTWLLCGSTVEADFEHDLRERIRSYALGSRVRLVGQRSDLADVFAAADLAVHTSVQPEPFGMVVVEAMAAGTAVVAPAEGALPDIVRDGVDGLLVPPRDAGALAGAIGRLLDDREALARMGAAAREHANVAFRVEGQARTLEAIYRRVLGRD